MEHPAFRYFAQVTSWVLHPLLLTTYAFLFISGLDHPAAVRLAPVRVTFTLLLFTLTFVIPALLVRTMQTLGLIRSVYLEERKDRTVPFLLTAIIYYITYRYLNKNGVPVELSLMMLGSAAVILIAMLINLRWKISIHMMGIGGMTGLLHGMAFHFPHPFFIPLALVIGFAGILGFSRLYLGSHTPAEVYAGFGVGYLVMYLLFSMALP